MVGTLSQKWCQVMALDAIVQSPQLTDSIDSVRLSSSLWKSDWSGC